jgi:hypothetical protein
MKNAEQVPKHAHDWRFVLGGTPFVRCACCELPLSMDDVAKALDAYMLPCEFHVPTPLPCRTYEGHFVGRREGRMILVRVPTPEQGSLTSWPLVHVIEHSPTGLEWGYGGSGPSDTALSLLTDAIASEGGIPVEVAKLAAMRWYMRFKRDMVSGLHRGEKAGLEWRLPVSSIVAWLERTERWHVGRARGPCAVCGGETPWATVAESGERTPSHLACVYGEEE